jgi:predicted nucleotidyltransferase
MGGNVDPKIVAFLKKARKKYKIEKAIFFGGRAREDKLKASNYYLILVSKDFEGVFFSQRSADMFELWDYYPLDIELFCYTPKEYKVRLKNIGIIQQAAKEGIAL